MCPRFVLRVKIAVAFLESSCLSQAESFAEPRILLSNIPHASSILRMVFLLSLHLRLMRNIMYVRARMSGILVLRMGPRLRDRNGLLS